VGGFTPESIVAVVILNWNSGDDILRCISKLIESTYKSIEVVVVDNGSIDGSSGDIRVRFPHIHFINNSSNYGFARGSNQGIRWALEHRFPYVLLLNADARLHSAAISELLRVATSEDDIVVACPKMYLGEEGNGSQRLWFAYGTVTLWAGIFHNPAFNHLDSATWSHSIDMEYASGCCMLIPTSILDRVGMLDESFFAYCEDIDFSLRIRKAGFRLRYVPSAYLWHGSSQPTERTSTSTYRYLSTRNNLWVVRKHGTWYDLIISICLLPLRSFFRIANMAARGQWTCIPAEVRGIRDGIFSDLTQQ